MPASPVHAIYDDGKVVITYDDGYNFLETFNRETGRHVTGNVIGTGLDPFSRSLPSLIDVGVMGFCKHAHFCSVGCYQGKSPEPDMTFDDFKSIIDQTRGYVFQCALGGRGDPNTHVNFEEIVSYARQNGVVPNYTTSGFGLTHRQAEITKEYCGAVAVSYYGKPYTTAAIDTFLANGCTTNIHYVLSNKSIEHATTALSEQLFPDVNAVIFLLHKPVGMGKTDDVLRYDDPRAARFFDVVQEQSGYKIGFDSCSIQGVMRFTDKFDLNSMDTCEGARFSCYISPGMVMTPCSFDQGFTWGVSLRDHTVAEAWNSEEFQDFRDRLKYGASGCVGNCKFSSRCTGACPIKPEIVLCDMEDYAR